MSFFDYQDWFGSKDDYELEFGNDLGDNGRTPGRWVEMLDLELIMGYASNIMVYGTILEDSNEKELKNYGKEVIENADAIAKLIRGYLD